MTKILPLTAEIPTNSLNVTPADETNFMWAIEEAHPKLRARVLNSQALTSDKPISIIVESKIDYDMFTVDDSDFSNDEFGSLDDPGTLTGYLKVQFDIKLTDQQLNQLSSTGELVLHLDVDSLPNNVDHGYLDMYFEADNHEMQEEQTHELKSESDVRRGMLIESGPQLTVIIRVKES